MLLGIVKAKCENLWFVDWKEEQVSRQSHHPNSFSHLLVPVCHPRLVQVVFCHLGQIPGSAFSRFPGFSTRPALHNVQTSQMPLLQRLDLPPIVTSMGQFKWSNTLLVFSKGPLSLILTKLTHQKCQWQHALQRSDVSNATFSEAWYPPIVGGDPPMLDVLGPGQGHVQCSARCLMWLIYQTRLTYNCVHLRLNN